MKQDILTLFFMFYFRKYDKLSVRTLIRKDFERPTFANELFGRSASVGEVSRVYEIKSWKGC